MKRSILAVASTLLLVGAAVAPLAAAKPDAKRTLPYGLRGRVKCFTEKRAQVTFENGKWLYVPTLVYYRDITYYEGVGPAKMGGG